LQFFVVLFSRQSRFIRPLPPALAKDKKFCTDLHSAFVEKTIEAIRENFDKVEESVKLKNRLDQLNVILQNEANKELIGLAWRPSDNALDNQAAHDKQPIIASRTKLENEVLAPLQEDVASLEKRVAALSDTIAERSAKINNILKEDPTTCDVTM
jgi:vacuolar-type H+-ATPase subunit I/STV1